ncbi:transcriptional regulator ATRX homolog [Rhopilema esculentum]|uniref:transcriptional regulator ATRX homolog n=1 Tax=Rhopilema esculentum TaxID=499914 RepID=UPI0031D90B1A|eukprot:gene2806-1031_t
MPRRRKIVLKKQKADVDVETSDDQEELPKRSLRVRSKTKPESKAESRNTPIKSKYGKKEGKKQMGVKSQQPEYAYDADSELDQRPGDSDEKMTSSPESDNEFFNESSKKTQETKIQLPDPIGEQLDKENFTPPGSHSTPALAQRAVRNLDDSLFGFNRLTTPLPYSPVTLGSSRAGLSPSSSLKYNSSSSLASLRTTQDSTIGIWKGKRKIEKQIDLPMENVKRGKKKKTKKEFPRNDDNLEELREQFKEVEMHELAIEYC